ncbi:MAG: hypothetical protein KDB90_08780 [Planctomycetes bacterium]|nr:hypothetical protein [Planctomycetota bacterium]
MKLEEIDWYLWWVEVKPFMPGMGLYVASPLLTLPALILPDSFAPWILLAAILMYLIALCWFTYIFARQQRWIWVLVTVVASPWALLKYHWLAYPFCLLILIAALGNARREPADSAEQAES